MPGAVVLGENSLVSLEGRRSFPYRMFQVNFRIGERREIV